MVLIDPEPQAAKRRQQQNEQMMGTFHKLTYHLVFSTKYRRRRIRGEFRERLYEYMGGIIRGQNGHLIEIGGIDDHVHLLLNLSPLHSVAAMLRDIKANASKWVNEIPDMTARFEWQSGYAAFTVSHSQVDVVREYIRNQIEHHRTKTFEEEFVELLKRHGVEFDMKYMFEMEHHG